VSPVSSARGCGERRPGRSGSSARGGACLGAGAVSAAAPDDGDDGEDRDHEEETQQQAGGDAEAAEGERDELDDAEADGEQQGDQQHDQQDTAHTDRNPGAGGGQQQSHGAQGKHLAAGWGRLAEALDSLFEIAGAALGECQGGVCHAPDLHPLLGAGGGDCALEVGAGLVGVEALGGAGAQDREGGGLELGLGLELLVGALLEGLDGLEGAALLHPDLTLLGGHGTGILDLGGSSAATGPGVANFAVAVAMLASIVRPIHRTMRAIRRTAPVMCILLALLVGAGLPGAAAAAELSAGEGLVERANKAEQEEGSSTATTTSAKQETETSSSSGTGTVLILSLLAGGLLLGGIAFVIVRDARTAAPVVEGATPGGSRNQQTRLRKRRAKARAAKRQRKRNR
jgi:hypothetical protein